MDEGKRERGHEYRIINWFDNEPELVQSAAQDDMAEIIKEEIWPDPIRYYDADSELADEEGEVSRSTGACRGEGSFDQELAAGWGSWVGQLPGRRTGSLKG